MSLPAFSTPVRRKVTIFGATGSVGVNTLDLIRYLRKTGEADIRIAALTANGNSALLAEQAIEFGAEMAVCADETCHTDLADRLAGTGIRVERGRAGLMEAAALEADWVMAAIVGIAGLEPVLVAAARGADIALANKECLVSAGDLLTKTMEAAGGTLLPVDSEHNAIFQVFDAALPEKVAGLTLTASGGPFREQSLAAMARVTPAQAVAHPNWDMGAKISVDSATMMNKGLELIEAAHLFPVSAEKIDILVHPQSVIHSLVSYVDGSVLAQLGTPDMRIPIASALAWPSRVSSPSERLDLAAVARLDFHAPDEKKFPALRLARQALLEGNGATAVLNAANEVAVECFLKGETGFLDIAAIAEEALMQSSLQKEGDLSSLDGILAIDQAARAHAREAVVRRRAA